MNVSNDSHTLNISTHFHYGPLFVQIVSPNEKEQEKQKPGRTEASPPPQSPQKGSFIGLASLPALLVQEKGGREKRQQVSIREGGRRQVLAMTSLPVCAACMAARWSVGRTDGRSAPNTNIRALLSLCRT